jgi:hypothetical protein
MKATVQHQHGAPEAFALRERLARVADHGRREGATKDSSDARPASTEPLGVRGAVVRGGAR